MQKVFVKIMFLHGVFSMMAMYLWVVDYKLLVSMDVIVFLV